MIVHIPVNGRSQSLSLGAFLGQRNILSSCALTAMMGTSPLHLYHVNDVAKYASQGAIHRHNQLQNMKKGASDLLVHGGPSLIASSGSTVTMLPTLKPLCSSKTECLQILSNASLSTLCPGCSGCTPACTSPCYQKNS